ncbi:LacI family DNA-binding transcriptional regulator [Streptomyces sp. NPDC001530]|uniref:LacI family DNA-binding transcriptional regulator n=1 Tax=Streptomyces sp. NPDC001530 TaxID=3364582 RepID=UPI00369EC21D
MLTIADAARHAGVSPSTVSHVLSSMRSVAELDLHPNDEGPRGRAMCRRRRPGRRRDPHGRRAGRPASCPAR